MQAVDIAAAAAVDRYGGCFNNREFANFPWLINELMSLSWKFRLVSYYE